MIQRRKKLTPEAIFVFISILLHICICVILYFKKVEPPRELENVEVRYVTPQDSTVQQLPNQIVEQKNRVNDEKDKAAKYLSAFDQKVIHQTRAENSGKFTNTVAGGASTHGQRQAKDNKKQKKTAQKEKGELPTLKDLTPAFSPTEGMAAEPSSNPGEAPQTDDYLKDVKRGMQTLLSTREFVYYTYYSRIKRQISQYWEPGVRERVKIIYLQGRSIASAHDRVTRLLIVLDKGGNLIRVEVLGRSGVTDLDDAAVEAFRAAAPFPNPPKGMVEKDGTIKIRWDFILEA